MDISINGKPADIVPDTEKTLGELLSALEAWLTGSGYRLSGLRVNGDQIDSTGVGEVFGLNLEAIHTLDISTSSWPELAQEALAGAEGFLRAWEAASFEERPRLQEDWRESAAAQFLSAEISAVFLLVEGALRGGEPALGEIAGIIGERLREITGPREEFTRVEGLVSAIAGRLEELPLDLQTGKDARAAETIQLFSQVAEKLFRLISLFKGGRFLGEEFGEGNAAIQKFIEEFSAALRELLSAYETRDTVLVGDLAEYEMAPRLRKLYEAMKGSAVVSL
jgi:hypothetical protein